MSTPSITISTPTFKGNKLSFTGTVDLHGDTGSAQYYLDPLPSGQALGPFALTITNKNVSVSNVKIARGTWKVRIVATTSSNETTTVSSNQLQVNRAVGQVVLSIPGSNSPVRQSVVTPVLDGDIQSALATAVAAAPVGSKRATAASSLVNIMGSRQTLQVTRNGVEMIRIEYAGVMTPVLYPAGLGLTTSAASSTTINAPIDFTSGKWEYVLSGGTTLGSEMRGTVGSWDDNADLAFDNGIVPGATIATEFTIGVGGINDPVIGDGAIELTDELHIAYAAAIVAAPLGSKRLAGANAIVSALRPAHSLNIYRNGELIIPVEYLGDCAIVDDGINIGVSLGIITSAIPTKNADITTGTWTFSIVGGANQVALISGTVGGEGTGASIILSESPAIGRPFDSSVILTIPRITDELE